MLTDSQKQIAWDAFRGCPSTREECCYAAVAAVLEDAQPAQTPNGEALTDEDWNAIEQARMFCGGISENGGDRLFEGQLDVVRGLRKVLAKRTYPAEQPSPQQDVVERMREAVNVCGWNAALGVAREGWVPASELEQQLASRYSELTNEEKAYLWGEFIALEKEGRYDRDSLLFKVVNAFLKRRLTAQPEPKPRVTIYAQSCGCCFEVQRDGIVIKKFTGGGNAKLDAERYAAGLKQEIGESDG